VSVLGPTQNHMSPNIREYTKNIARVRQSRPDSGPPCTRAARYLASPPPLPHAAFISPGGGRIVYCPLHTLHPTTDTLDLTLFTLFSLHTTHYTLLTTHFTLHPTPYVHHTPYTLYLPCPCCFHCFAETREASAGRVLERHMAGAISV